jgi:hypothetical protein
LPDLIAADKYLRARKRKGVGVRPFRIIPPGASGVDRCGHRFNDSW